MINRYFNEDNFARFLNDFSFLQKTFKAYKGELDISLRDQYLNLYFRGNNAAKIMFKANGIYEIEIHEKFFSPRLEEDARFSSTLRGNYRVIRATSELLHPLLQKSHLDEIYSKIKRENYSEELNFEQMLMTDNLERDDLILIDRQVTDKNLRGRRMDLLALKQVQENHYQFLVLEVKMGNNPELKDDVAEQVNTYIAHVNENFKAYKKCYEKQYIQKKEFGLIETPMWDEIEIVKDVQGMIIVGGYSRLAQAQITTLKDNHPKLEVRSFTYRI